MARLIMLSGNLDSTPNGQTVIHPRTKRAVGRFGLTKIIVWNATGTVGGSWSGLGETDVLGTYGVLELYDEYDSTHTSTSTPTAANRAIRVPVSGKSRLVLELPGNGMMFETGIRVAIGSEKSSNSGHYMYYQLLGYEY